MTLAAERPTKTTFDSFAPSTGEVVATFPVQTAAEVQTAVDRARAESAWWQGLGYDGRRKHLDAWRAHLVKKMPELKTLISLENGKPEGDAQIELVLAIDHLDWAAKHARKVLGERRVASGILQMNHAAFLEYAPLGVIGVKTG
jgi:acyl-CoA reductase-like NAD-dependent aldehyde dehydrogenase